MTEKILSATVRASDVSGPLGRRWAREIWRSIADVMAETGHTVVSRRHHVFANDGQTVVQFIAGGLAA